MNKHITYGFTENGVKRETTDSPCARIEIVSLKETEIWTDKAASHCLIGLSEGYAEIDTMDDRKVFLATGGIVFLARRTGYTITARKSRTTIVQCRFGKILPVDTVALVAAAGITRTKTQPPTLVPDERVAECLRGIAVQDGLAASDEWCTLKTRELVLVAELCYGRAEMANLFRPLLRAKDNFEEFVISNYEQAGSVGQMADMAGMGLSTFKRQFREVFDDSVYQWMMKQKAAKVRLEIEAGNRDIQDLMSRFDFQCHSHFNRFCHTYLGASPSQLTQNKITDNQRHKDTKKNT